MVNFFSDSISTCFHCPRFSAVENMIFFSNFSLLEHIVLRSALYGTFKKNFYYSFFFRSKVTPKCNVLFFYLALTPELLTCSGTLKSKRVVFDLGNLTVIFIRIFSTFKPGPPHKYRLHPFDQGLSAKLLRLMKSLTGNTGVCFSLRNIDRPIHPERADKLCFISKFKLMFPQKYKLHLFHLGLFRKLSTFISYSTLLFMNI